MVTILPFRGFFAFVTKALEDFDHPGDWRINLVETGSG